MLHKKSLKLLLTLLFSTHIFIQAENDKLEKEASNPLKPKFDLQVKRENRGQQNQNILIATAATCVASALVTYGITYAFQIYKAQKEIKQQQSKISGLESTANIQKTSENKEIEELKKQMQKLNEEKDSLTKNMELTETLNKEIVETFLKSDGRETIFNLRDDEKSLSALTILFNRFIRLNCKNSNNKDLSNKNLSKQDWHNFISQFIAELKIEKAQKSAAQAKPATSVDNPAETANKSEKTNSANKQ